MCAYAILKLYVVLHLTIAISLFPNASAGFALKVGEYDGFISL